jgi:hypothetical protein
VVSRDPPLYRLRGPLVHGAPKPVPASYLQSTGSIRDVTELLVCHYVAWLLVGCWGVAGVILSSPCFSGTFVYPLLANTAAVVLIVTPFVCRRALSW